VRPLLPSGQQIHLARGDQRATVVEVGAALRTYTVAGDDLIEGFDATEMSTGGRGQVLAPWPNRIEDGAYEFGGRKLQLPLSEPEAGNAIHGLVRFADWVVAESSPHHVVMAHRLHAQPGYPFVLDLRVAYALGPHGLTSRTEAVNRGVEPCPFGAGAHPYLRRGAGPVDHLRLRLPATTYYTADERGIPTGRLPVAGTPYDFREERAIGGLRVDTAFTDLERDADGRAVVSLSDSRGCTRLWVGPGFEHLMVFTGDTLPPDRRRSALAVEPMTCAPNAFRTSDGLITLAPGASVAVEWGITRG